MNTPTRLDHIGTLVAAAIAVLLTGDMPLAELAVPPSPEQVLRRNTLYRALSGRVAARLGVSRSAVMATARRPSTSARIADALAQEIAQIEIEARSPEAEPMEELAPPVPPSARYASPFSSAARAEFKSGGRYRGLLTAVAKRLGRSPSYIGAVSCGQTRSAFIVCEIRAEMRQWDAQLGTSLARGKLTPAERAEFLPGGRYRGILKAVAGQMGISASYVSQVARDQHFTPKVMVEIRREMAKRDAAAHGGAQ